MSTPTQTQSSTKTKVIVGLLFAGAVIAAFGAGWVWSIKVMGVKAVSGNTATGDVNLGPEIPRFESDGDSLGDSTNFNTNSGSNSNSNSNSGANTNGGTNTGGTNNQIPQ